MSSRIAHLSTYLSGRRAFFRGRCCTDQGARSSSLRRLCAIECRVDNPSRDFRSDGVGRTTGSRLLEAFASQPGGTVCNEAPKTSARPAASCRTGRPAGPSALEQRRAHPVAAVSPAPPPRWRLPGFCRAAYTTPKSAGCGVAACIGNGAAPQSSAGDPARLRSDAGSRRRVDHGYRPGDPNKTRRALRDRARPARSGETGSIDLGRSCGTRNAAGEGKACHRRDRDGLTEGIQSIWPRQRPCCIRRQRGLCRTAPRVIPGQSRLLI